MCKYRQPARERFVLGCFLICTFMRARFSDMMNLVDFTSDSFEHEGLPGGGTWRPGWLNIRSQPTRWKGKLCSCQ